MNLTEKRSDQIGLAIIITLAVFIVFLLANINFSANVGGADSKAQITVSGEASAFAVPDTATFTYTVTVEGNTAQNAQAEIASDAAAILAALGQAGVAEADIKTQNFNVYPRYEYRQATAAAEPGVGGGIEPFFPGDRTRVLVGYEATQTNQVRVRDVDTAGELLGLVTENGADNVSQLDFVIWDEAAVESEARADAIDDATTKAEELADQLGVRLGDIIEFNESSNDYPKPFEARLEMDMAVEELGGATPANISLGENEIRKTVTITFEIR